MRPFPPATDAPLGVLRSEKVAPGQRDRLAVVYVRQSTPQQVLDHQESTRLQSGLVERARALGWAADRVLVIDADLGRSARRADERAGFQRLVSEVSRDHVGLVRGLAMRRLARSTKDWYQRLELCALFRTLIADLDGVYDPAQSNDRRLLGLKGTLREAERHVLQQRMHQGRLSKARRGELTFPVPIGDGWGPDGEIRFEPDEQVQAVVRLVVRTFGELRTLHGVVRYLADQELRLGVRVRAGPGTGALVWRRPNRLTLQLLLKHPLSAGADVSGRRQGDPRRRQAGRPRSGRVGVPPTDWRAFVPERAPASSTGAEYEADLAPLAANRAWAPSRGVARAGAALLAGRVTCARCGTRLIVRYDGTPARPTSVCSRRATDYGEPHCQQVAAGGLDRCVVGHVLAALEPAALELALTATERIDQERAELLQPWEQRRARAAYAAVEPEHRLVARTLERRWEERLAAQQPVEEGYQRVRRDLSRTLSEAERTTSRRLALDSPARWLAPTTTHADRTELIRQIVERVVVNAVGASEQVPVRSDGAGGAQIPGVVRRPIQRTDALSTCPEICDRVRAGVAAGRPAAASAERLHTDGYRPPRGERFGVQAVRVLRQQLGLSGQRPRRHARTDLGPDAWWRTELAHTLGIPTGTLDSWIERGWVRARQEPRGLRRWIVWADAAEVERLRQFRQRPLDDAIRQRWLDRQGGPDDSTS